MANFTHILKDQLIYYIFLNVIRLKFNLLGLFHLLNILLKQLIKY